MRLQKTKWKQKRSRPDGPPVRSFIGRQGSTHHPHRRRTRHTGSNAGKVNRRPSRWRRDASKAASGKGLERLAHRAYHAHSLRAPLFASSGSDYSASADKSWGAAYGVLIASKETADGEVSLRFGADLRASAEDTFRRGPNT